jgi:hypothetical protein
MPPTCTARVPAAVAFRLIGPAMAMTRCLPLAVALALFAATGSMAAPTRIRAAAMACDVGPYAVVLPRHYPSLHVIGKHQWTDIESRSVGGVTSTRRRIAYYGMTAEVLLSSAAPNAYRLLALEVISRRWHIGPLSVGHNPWRTVKDRSLEGVSQDGVVELVGARDSVQLTLRGGRVDKVSYQCASVSEK